MKFVFATLAATASALPWEKEVACGFDSACGFDVVVDEATGCGFDNGLGVGLGSVTGIGGYNIYEDDNKGTNYHGRFRVCRVHRVQGQGRLRRLQQVVPPGVLRHRPTEHRVQERVLWQRRHRRVQQRLVHRLRC